MTTNINAINNTNPAIWIMAYACRLTGFLRIASRIRKIRRPPSNAGIGSKFITPRFADKSTAILSILAQSILLPSGFAAS